MRLEIPTRKWAELASRWRGFTHEVILLSYSEAFAEQFRTALKHVRKAQDLVDEARFTEAVETCRKALERSLWHAYRRGWATSRKHLPDVDVAAAGGWKSTETL